jgi:hypothetical protein
VPVDKTRQLFYWRFTIYYSREGIPRTSENCRHHRSRCHGIVVWLVLVLWFVGSIGGVGGNLIHLLLILAIMVLPIGVAAGVDLIVFSARQARRTQ